MPIPIIFRRRGPGPRFRFPSQLQDQLSSLVVGPAEYLWGTHAATIDGAERVKSRLFASAAALIVPAAVATFVYAPQQSYADVQPTLWSLKSAGTTPNPIPRVMGAPQLADLTLQAAFQESLSLGNQPSESTYVNGAPQLADLTLQPLFQEALLRGNRPSQSDFLSGSQTDPSQVAAMVWGPQPAPLVVASPVGEFVAIAPQSDPSQITPATWRSQPAPLIAKLPPSEYVWGTQTVQLGAAEGLKSQFFKSLVAPPTASNPIASFVKAAPQLADLTLQPEFIPAAVAAPPIGEVGIYGAPQTDPSQVAARIFPVAITPLAVVSYGLRTLYGAPQADPSQVAADVFPAVMTRVGPVRPIYGAPQTDPSQLAASISPAAPKISYGLRSIVGAPQADPSQLAPSLFPAAAPPALIGTVPSFTWTMPQYDLTLQGMVIPAMQIGTTPPLPSLPAQGGTIGGIERWTIQIPKPPKKKEYVFRRNMENLDRADLEDIVALVKNWLEIP